MDMKFIGPSNQTTLPIARQRLRRQRHRRAISMPAETVEAGLQHAEKVKIDLPCGQVPGPFGPKSQYNHHTDHSDEANNLGPFWAILPIPGRKRAKRLAGSSFSPN